MVEASPDTSQKEQPWKWDVFSLFPQWFSWMHESRPVHNVVENRQMQIDVHDLRKEAPDRHRHIDDMPYGGGPGMIIRVDRVVNALETTFDLSIEQMRQEKRIVLLSPAGVQFDDALADSWATERRPTVVLCGRYEGFDYRLHEHVATGEISMGPFVMSGGEIPAMAMLDAVCRKLPGALGNSESLTDETFSASVQGGSEYPHYTRPAVYRDWHVPDVLLSGNHANIKKWRSREAAARHQGPGQ